MTITTKHGCIFITLEGALRTFDPDLLSRLVCEVKQINRPGPTVLIIDMTNVTDIDAAGIGLLMGCYAIAAIGDGQIALCGANAVVASSLITTRLLPLFRSYRRVEDAIESWTSGWSAPPGGATPCGSDVARGHS